MHLANINWLAVIIAAVAGWLVGAVWYSVLSKQWLAAQGKTTETAKQEAGGQSLPVLLIIVFVANLIMAVMLSGIMTHVGPFTVRSGMISGALIWFGFVHHRDRDQLRVPGPQADADRDRRRVLARGAAGDRRNSRRVRQIEPHYCHAPRRRGIRRFQSVRVRRSWLWNARFRGCGQYYARACVILLSRGHPDPA